MTPNAPQMTREEALERGRQARAEAARDMAQMVRHYVAALFGKTATA